MHVTTYNTIDQTLLHYQAGTRNNIISQHLQHYQAANVLHYQVTEYLIRHLLHCREFLLHYQALMTLTLTIITLSVITARPRNLL